MPPIIGCASFVSCLETHEGLQLTALSSIMFKPSIAKMKVICLVLIYQRCNTPRTAHTTHIASMPISSLPALDH